MSESGSLLLRLYPRAWRERYGDELLALVGEGPLGFIHTINIVAGAVDAHLSSDVRKSAAASVAASAQGGSAVIDTLKRNCGPGADGLTLRDGWIGAVMLIGATVVLSGAGIALGRLGFKGVDEFLKALAFPASSLVATNFLFLKRQPWKVQAVLTGGGLAFVAAACLGAAYL